MSSILLKRTWLAGLPPNTPVNPDLEADMNRRSLPTLVTAIAALFGLKVRTADAARAPKQERLCWNADDWETTYDAQDINMLAHDMQPGDVMRTGRAIVTPDVWIVLNAEQEVREFATEAEALAFAAVVKAAEA